MKSVLIFSLLLISGSLFAQNEEKMKEILFMVVDGDYEKAIKKSEKFTENKDTRREPLPYLYSAMAYYEMSKSEEFQEDYPRAFRDAIKNAYKFRRYDESNTYAPQHQSFLSDLKRDVMREAMFYYSEGDYRRSSTYSKYLTRIDPYDVTGFIMKGLGEAKSRNEYQAVKTFEEAGAMLDNLSTDLTLDEKESLKTALQEYVTYAKEEGKTDLAEKYLDAVQPIFDNSEDIEQMRNSL